MKMSLALLCLCTPVEYLLNGTVSGEPGVIINTLDFSDSELGGAWVSNAWGSNGLCGLCGCVPVVVPENVLCCFITSFLLACSNPGLASILSLVIIESVESLSRC